MTSMTGAGGGEPLSENPRVEILDSGKYMTSELEDYIGHEGVVGLAENRRCNLNIPVYQTGETLSFWVRRSSVDVFKSELNQKRPVQALDSELRDVSGTAVYRIEYPTQFESLTYLHLSPQSNPVELKYMSGDVRTRPIEEIITTIKTFEGNVYKCPNDCNPFNSDTKQNPLRHV